MILPERLAAERLQTLVKTSNKLLARADPMPRLRFDLRGRCAGQALLRDWAIRLNISLLREHGEAFVEDTVPHEWAHLLTFSVFGPYVKPHGEEWQSMMHTLGHEPNVCHQYEVKPARKLRQFMYYCACGEHPLSSIRHKRVLAGAKYNCRRCGQTLKTNQGMVV